MIMKPGARSARAVRPGKQNLGTVFASTTLPLCPLPVSELNGKDCGTWLRPQIICDQAETYGVTLRQVLWGKGQAPSFFPENMVLWESFSNPNQGQKNKDAFLEFKAVDVLRQAVINRIRQKGFDPSQHHEKDHNTKNARTAC